MSAAEEGLCFVELMSINYWISLTLFSLLPLTLASSVRLLREKTNTNIRIKTTFIYLFTYL